MFKIKASILKTNLFKIPALEYFSITCNKRYKNTGQIENVNPVEKQNKRLINHCILMSYSGAKYIGMQYLTQDCLTIESVLFKAMLETDWVRPASYHKPYKIKYQHGSRTDMGVSAARQCCSMLLPADVNVQELNRRLPDDIRVFGVKRVTDAFNARHFCMARTYTYTLPTIAFCHYNDQISQKEYRISSEKLQFVSELLQVYKGWKNFHNFTSKKEYKDRSSWRDMLHLELGPPFLVDDVEFCVIRIKGRSFMMHMIRKMVGMLLAVTREVTDSNIFNVAFTEKQVRCPTAPGLGLVLDRLHFDDYNRKLEEYQKLTSNRKSITEKLTWEECDENVEEFHEKFIKSNIVQTEIQNEEMLQWVEVLLNHQYIPEDDSDSPSESHTSYL